MNYNNLSFEINEKTGYVFISRPDALNALNDELIEELRDIFEKIDADDGIRAVIITGKGKAFAAGADIAQMRAMTAGEGRDMAIRGQKVMELIENSSKPVIAAINGYALGGGNELAMACDIRIASENAKFGQPEVGLGIIPGYGGTQRLPRLVGKGMAKKLLMTGDIISAEEALDIGLVDEVVPKDELMNAAKDLAERIKRNAPIAVKLVKSAVNSGMNTDLKSAIQLEAEAFAGAFMSDDRIEGMSAFLEKREADFKNK